MADQERGKKRATYQDVLDAPEHVIAEIVDGKLVLSPRPRSTHARVAGALNQELGPRFDHGRGGPGGWILLPEPELHFGDDIVVPDLAGWRRERLPHVPDVPYFTLAPDWVCEILSPSTQKLDRTKKLSVYARAGILHAWLVHPIWRTVEVFRLHDHHWLTVAFFEADAHARIEPFDAVELDLATFWADLWTPTQASEAAAEYNAASDW